MVNPALPPIERVFAILDGVFLRWPQPLVMSVAFTALTGSFWFILTACSWKRGPLRRLLASSAITAGVMLLMLLSHLVRIR